MSFSIRSNGGRQLAEVEIERLGGQAGLGHFRLLLTLKVRLDRAQEAGERLLDLTAEALVGGVPLGCFRGSPQGSAIRSITGDWPSSVGLEMELDRPRLEALEARRLGSGLDLILNLHADVETAEGGLRREFNQVVYNVNQGVWVSILEQMGYRKTLLIEVPVPSQTSVPALRSAVDMLSRSQLALERGDYREAVGLCRDVLESMSTAIGEDDSQISALQELFAGQRQMDKAQRLQVLRRALKAFTHPARHQDVNAAGIQWSRADAVAAVTMAAVLMASAPTSGHAKASVAAPPAP